MGMSHLWIGVESVNSPFAKSDGRDMHGFYLQGTAGTPGWNRARSVAELPDGQNVPLDIKRAGGKALIRWRRPAAR